MITPLIATECVCVARLHAALGLSGLALITPLIATDYVCVARLHAALGLSGLALTYSMTLTALAKYALPLDCALIAP